jgi:DNA polymerase IV
LYHPDQVASPLFATAKSNSGRVDKFPRPNEALQDLKRGNSSRRDHPQPRSTCDKETAEDTLELAIRDVRVGADIGLALDLSEESGSGDEDAHHHAGVPIAFNGNTAANVSRRKAGFLCMESHNGASKGQNANAQTIEKLQEMATMYESRGDQWRTKAFREAIGRLRRHSQLIRTSQEARNIGLGESVAAQVEEIVSTGRYKRLEYAQNDPRTQVLKLFKGVYGAGEATAYSWIAQGFRTLEGLRNKADLTPNQRIGLEHYDDFQQRIPRKEVEQHAAVVERALQAADPKLQLIVGGSYRRGSKDSGDIDCIITMEGADIVRIRTLMLDTVIPALTDQGFLKVALAAGRSSRDDTSKWHGASVLPGSERWRRIDFLFVPWEELGAALIYFTGNDLFNRSIRFLAGKKGMRLNQHGLCKHVMRGPKRQRINDGTLVESHDERRIFQILGVPYRAPEDRNV